MSSHPATVRQCQHIKVDGTNCGSPAMREEKCCYFHVQWRLKSRKIKFIAHQRENERANERATLNLPTLEDANSVQLALAEVMRALATQQIDHRTAALLLYAFQIASYNVKQTSFEPKHPKQVVPDLERFS